MKEVNKHVVKFTENKPLMDIVDSLFKSQTYSKFSLVGGAVIDILDGKTPKDYDFVDFTSSKNYQKLNDNGFKFISETSTAITYSFKGKKVQFLKRMPEQFEFTISTSSCSFQKNKSPILTIDKYVYKNRVLIPINIENWYSCLYRIPHWVKKGFSIDDSTYLSLVNMANKKTNAGES